MWQLLCDVSEITIDLESNFEFLATFRYVRRNNNDAVLGGLWCGKKRKAGGQVERQQLSYKNRTALHRSVGVLVSCSTSSNSCNPSVVRGTTGVVGNGIIKY